MRLFFLLGAVVFYRIKSQASYAEYFVRINQDLNIREGPGIQYNIIGVYSSGSYATVIGEYNNWYKVSLTLNSKYYVGWINKAYTTKP